MKRHFYIKFLEFVADLLYTVDDYRKMPYHQYLHTTHWKRFREEKLLSVDRRCQVCYDNKKLQVHHRTYERIGHERLNDTTVLCDDCHKLFHKHKRLKKNEH